MPNGIDETLVPWDRTGDKTNDTKYPYICHAELNAILNASFSNNATGSTLYVTLFPCNECAKAIIQMGIKRVVYFENKYAGTESVQAAEYLFKLAGVEVDEYHRTKSQSLYHYKYQ